MTLGGTRQRRRQHGNLLCLNLSCTFSCFVVFFFLLPSLIGSHPHPYRPRSYQGTKPALFRLASAHNYCRLKARLSATLCRGRRMCVHSLAEAPPGHSVLEAAAQTAGRGLGRLLSITTLALAFAALSSAFPVQLCSFQRSPLVPNVQLFCAKVASERLWQKVPEKVSSLDWPLSGRQLRFIRNDLGSLKFHHMQRIPRGSSGQGGGGGGNDLGTIVFITSSSGILSLAFYYVTHSVFYTKKKCVFEEQGGSISIKISIQISIQEGESSQSCDKSMCLGRPVTTGND